MWSSIYHSLFHGLREREAMMLIAAGGVALFVGSISAWLGAQFGAKRAVRRAFRDRIEIPSLVTESSGLADWPASAFRKAACGASVTLISRRCPLACRRR